MSRLLRVELARLLARRAVLVLLVAAVLLPLLIGVARILDTRPPSDAQIAEAERQVAVDAESRWVRRELERCQERPQRYGVDGADDVAAACEKQVMPTVESYLWFPRLSLVEERKGGSIAVIVVLSLTMLLLGTTFAGHDWASGSMSNQLLFEPRRSRVWAAKAAVVAGVGALVAAVITSGFWLLLAAAVRHRYGGPRAGVLLDCLQQGWWGAGVAAAAGLAGFALAMLFRSTVAAVGVIAVVAIAGGLLLAVLGVASAWDPTLNAMAVVNGHATYYTEVPCPDGTPGCAVEETLSRERGLLLLGSAVVVAVVVSMGSFGRRDVP